MSSSAKDQWFSLLGEALRDGSFVKLTLGGPRHRNEALRNVLVRRVELKDGSRLSFVYRYPTCDVTKNFPLEEALALVHELVDASFRHAHLFTTRSTVELKLRDRKGAWLIKHQSARQAPVATAHDRPKRRLIDPHSGWLQALGVTTADGHVAKGMEAKFRQINKFVEVLDHLLADAGGRPSSGAETPTTCLASEHSEAARNSDVSAPEDGRTPAATDELTVVDMGCGKGYLTFAAYDWLRRSDRSKAAVRGIEARRELVELCNRVAKENHFDRLHFEAGGIADATLDRADALIALHACDTATDDALAKGVQAGAALIIVSPCCHKELRPQLRPPPVLAGALRHGILLERHAEFITDALRATLLEWAGYDTKVFEFIATEHTAKNLMIAATRRRGRPHREEDARKARELAAFYGIRQQRLAARLSFKLTDEVAPT